MSHKSPSELSHAGLAQEMKLIATMVEGGWSFTDPRDRSRATRVMREGADRIAKMIRHPVEEIAE